MVVHVKILGCFGGGHMSVWFSLTKFTVEVYNDISNFLVVGG